MNPMRISLVAFCAAGTLAPVTAHAQVESRATARAGYTSLPLITDDNLVLNPLIGQVVSAAALQGPNAFSTTRAEGSIALTAIGGTARSGINITAASPPSGPPTGIFADCTVRNKATWTTVSTSLPLGSPIDVKVIIPMHGTVGTAGFFGPLFTGDVTADASALMTVDGTTVYEGGVHAESVIPGFAGATGVFSTSGAWASGTIVPATVDTGLGEIDGFEIHAVDVVNHHTVLNAPIDIVFQLTTAGFVVDPFEGVSISDFLSTGEYTLQAFDPSTGAALDDVKFVLVPTPGALALLGISALAARRRR